MTTRTPEELEEKLHYHFKNKELLITALTHSSYANESKTPTLYNERLEFLGDSVLSVVVANYLFHHSTRPEGELSRMRASLVSEDALFQFAQDIDLGSYLLLGRGELLTGGFIVPVMTVAAGRASLLQLLRLQQLGPCPRLQRVGQRTMSPCPQRPSCWPTTTCRSRLWPARARMAV